MRVAKDGSVYAETWTFSDDMPTTDGVHDRTHNGGADYYVARVSSDGSDLMHHRVPRSLTVVRV